MAEYTSKAIRQVLEDYGLPVFSVRKHKRYYGGRKFCFSERGLARQSHSKGTPEWFFRVELLSNPGVTEEDYELAAIVLREAGYKWTKNTWRELSVPLTHKLNKEHRKRLKA